MLFEKEAREDMLRGIQEPMMFEIKLEGQWEFSKPHQGRCTFLVGIIPEFPKSIEQCVYGAIGEATCG